MFSSLEELYEYYQEQEKHYRKLFPEHFIADIYRIRKIQIEKDTIQNLEMELNTKLHPSLVEIIQNYSFGEFQGFGNIFFALDISKIKHRNKQNYEEREIINLCDRCLIIADAGGAYVIAQDQESGYIYAIDLENNFDRTLIALDALQFLFIAAYVANTYCTIPTNDKKQTVVENGLANILDEKLSRKFWLELGMNWI
jgi:hypothetical protein